MSDLPSSFSSLPDQDPHKYFRNLLIALKKEVEGAIDVKALQEKMQAIINAAKEMNYQDTHKNSIFHKPETEKALNKLWSEFDRYILTYQKNPAKVEDQDLLDAIAIVNTLFQENDIY